MNPSLLPIGPIGRGASLLAAAAAPFALVLAAAPEQAVRPEPAPQVQRRYVTKVHSEIPPLERATIFEASTDVVLGVVRDITAVSSDGSLVSQHVEVVPSKRWKGHSDGSITVRVLGGELGALKTVANNSPSFSVGEEVVLYLSGSPFHRTATLTAGDQSCGRVFSDADGEKQVLFGERFIALEQLVAEDFAFAQAASAAQGGAK